MVNPMEKSEVFSWENRITWLEKMNQQEIIPCGVVCTNDYEATLHAVETVTDQKVHIMPMKDYGKSWRCWSVKPTDKERNETVWC